MKRLSELQEQMKGGAYDGYVYSYPHKAVYRELTPRVPLRSAWEHENTQQLYLYTHLPFCEMRCGFCNLFTAAVPPAQLVSNYLEALAQEMEVVADEIAPQGIAQAAFGGGTPSYLSISEIERLFLGLQTYWPVDLKRIPVSFEVSPGTLHPEKLHLLHESGIDRISMGLQSYAPLELKELGRPQKNHQVDQAILEIKEAGFPILNLDLIYGISGQTMDSWVKTLDTVLAHDPEELYLYPLYVRANTRMGQQGAKPNEHRRALHQVAKEKLMDAGYVPRSMRLFRKKGAPYADTEYCCQEDAMVGLGAGARSYTRSLHYSSEYAVNQGAVRGIIQDYANKPARDHGYADFGARLNSEEQKRRYVLKSILHADGLNLQRYQGRFSSDVFDDFSELQHLIELGLAETTTDTLMLTDEGFSFSDTIGPWLYSPEVCKGIMEGTV